MGLLIGAGLYLLIGFIIASLIVKYNPDLSRYDGRCNHGSTSKATSFIDYAIWWPLYILVVIFVEVINIIDSLLDKWIAFLTK